VRGRHTIVVTASGFHVKSLAITTGAANGVRHGNGSHFPAGID
jgi:hypothetical protein